jgi:predicted regulator of Ras-like GTPase activity (Roadblock/LC7/MglB family)
MLTLFKKIFGKSEPKAVAPVAVIPAAPSTPMPTIEVAHLSLAAITSRFPEEIMPLLVKQPDENVTVALPLPTILKQLPTGCVKMSLGTLQRQAHGLIKPLPPGDKRTVDVPLAEIFRHVRLSSLRRRMDQRPVMVPEIGFNLFGDSSNPYAVSPDDHLEHMQVTDLAPNGGPEPQPRPDGQRVLKMDDGLREHFGSAAAARSLASASEQSATTPRGLAPSAEMFAPKAAAPAPIAKPTGSTLALKIVPLAAGWPEEIRTEVEALDPGTVVTLPTDEVGAGLGKGRVSFSWAQIHAWLEPAAPPMQAAGATVLLLPLKIVAPAFLSSNKPATERKSFAMDASIPALFSDGRPPEPVAEPVAEPEAPVAEPQAEAEAHAEAEVHAEAEIHAEPVAEAVAHEEHSAPEAAVEHHEPQKFPESVGEIFGQPHKEHWTPSEIVAGTVTLPGVAGAIVALQEGLQVAASLPEGVKSDVIAAFLPQIFARLNQYSNEMKLGDVDDLLFTTHGAHCQIYRLGYVYLAVLGKPGESLPWHELRLISEELARQTHK